VWNMTWGPSPFPPPSLAMAFPVLCLAHMYAVDNRVCVCYCASGSGGKLVRIPVSAPLLLQVPVNEPPTAITLSNSNVLEGSANALVGTFSCTDPESNTCTFAITSATTLFRMVGTSLYTNVAIEQAQYPSVVLQIQATDNGSPAQTRSQSFTIVVTYVPRLPGVSNTAMSIAENSGTGAYVGVFANSQPSAQLTFTMVSATPTAGMTVFSLQACSGAFFVAQVRVRDSWLPRRIPPHSPPPLSSGLGCSTSVALLAPAGAVLALKQLLWLPSAPCAPPPQLSE
jgi:hypothetical protein